MTTLPTHRQMGNLLLGLLLLFFAQCQPNVSEEHQTAAGLPGGDTATVTSFHVERETSPALAKWAVFEAGREIICVPPGWARHSEDHGQEMVLLPPNGSDSTERVTFTRLAKDSPSLDFLALARRLAMSAFSRFGAAEADTLNHLVFPHDFAVERNVGLQVQDRPYRGYCLVYVNDQYVYQFRILLAQERLNAYSGNLLRDIIGNLHIDGKPFVEHAKQLQQVIQLH